MNDLGNRLKELRISKKMTMEEVGEEVGASKVAVSRWESGQRKPKPEYIKAYADFFNVSQEWIRYGYPDVYISCIARREFLKKGYDEKKITGLVQMIQARFFHRNKNKNLNYYPSEEEIIQEVKSLNPEQSSFIKRLLESAQALDEPFELLGYYVAEGSRKETLDISEDISEDECEEIIKRLQELLEKCYELKREFYKLYKSLSNKK